MTALSHAAADSATMLRRNLRHLARYPTMVLMTLAIPVLLLLLFVGVFGGALTTGLGDSTHGGAYVDYVVPGILLMTVGYGATTTAMAVNRDMTEGIIARFRTMSIARASVLTGHVVGAVIQTMVGLALVLAVALLVGFRPDASPVEWLAAIGVLAMTSFALSWLSVAMGLSTKTVEAASNLPMPLMLLPFFGSGFVPVESMPAGLAWFAEHQPFTPIIETVRGLLTGTAIGSSGLVATAWCAGIALVGYLWARRNYERRPAR